MRHGVLKLTKLGAAAGAAMILGCGGGHDQGLVAVEPDAPAVLVGETLPLTGSPQYGAGAELSWEVQEAYGGGLLQSQGPRVTYVPPEAAGTYHLVVQAPGRSGRMQKQVVEIRVLPSPAIDPASARVHPGFTLAYRARMKGLPRDTVTWAVEEPEGGEISQDGRYTAPRRPGVYHVTATSVIDPTAVARATVTVAGD